MKKVFCVLMLIFCINVPFYSQIINESIPVFAEKLFTLNKSSAENNLVSRGFNILSRETLLQFGYDKDSLQNLIVGLGDYKISCKIQTNNTGRYIEKVTIGGVRYLNAKYMINEYQMEGYILDEEKSTRNELVFIKRTEKYIYIAFAAFMVNPNMCMTNAEFRRATKK